MKYSGIVLISDLDGTLLDEDRRLSVDNLNAIKNFTENGGQFGIATGRMEQTTRKSFPELPVNVPSIFYNGALIYDLEQGKKVRESLISKDMGSFFQGFLDRFPDLGMEINCSGRAYILRGNEILSTQLMREGLDGIEAGWDMIPGGWYKVLLAASHECLVKVKDLFGGFKRPDICVVFSERQLLDIMAGDVSKGNALNFLRKKFNWKNVVAIGDSENDITLLESADIGVAVANASEAVKKASSHIIKTNRTPCIPQVLRIIDEVFLKNGL